MPPIILPANQPPNRFYAGGPQIAALRSHPASASHEPEDWIASTTCCAGHQAANNNIGLTRLPSGTLLRDAVSSSPEKWLGPGHVAKYGADTKLLVKLLDAGQRLPVHAHPHVDWAAKHLHDEEKKKHGKAEAWYILTPGTVWLGFREDVDPEELLRVVQEGRGAELLERMHEIDVEPHQTVYVPPGVVHSIGEGLFVVEVQEPSDMSILCEWSGFKIDGAKEGHLGVGFETALTAVETKGRTREEAMKLVTEPRVAESLCVEESRRYFLLERVLLVKSKSSSCRRGFAVVVVLEGHVVLKTEFGGEGLDLTKGATVVVPYEDGEITLEGRADVVIARPPE
ncbi:RmlC-like cupin [Trichoderma citrinoviride]|uniref:RmlC-like cupin n=1 Tax=Trichoderma citrinoviride TaxID=58853 RepID=A0A2T4BJA8_9HYPO|nr:RmlC-like cupin [Trichoderma citrinoviride]PTB69339.1 RmlC-like cupin [Trichoderma citrinoviride]